MLIEAKSGKKKYLKNFHGHGHRRKHNTPSRNSNYILLFMILLFCSTPSSLGFCWSTLGLWFIWGVCNNLTSPFETSTSRSLLWKPFGKCLEDHCNGRYGFGQCPWRGIKYLQFCCDDFCWLIQLQRKRRKQWQYENGKFGPSGILGIKRVQSRNSWFTYSGEGWSPKYVVIEC